MAVGSTQSGWVVFQRVKPVIGQGRSALDQPLQLSAILLLGEGVVPFALLVFGARMETEGAIASEDRQIPEVGPPTGGLERAAIQNHGQFSGGEKQVRQALAHGADDDRGGGEFKTLLRQRVAWMTSFS